MAQLNGLPIGPNRVFDYHFVAQDEDAGGKVLEASKAITGDDLTIGPEDPPWCALYRGENTPLFPIVEEALYGARAGDTIKVRVLPGPDGTGQHDPDDVRPIALEHVPHGLEVGELWEVEEEETGESCLVRLVSINEAEGTALIDWNEPTAGKTVLLTYYIVAVRNATPEEIRAGEPYVEDEDEEEEEE